MMVDGYDLNVIDKSVYRAQIGYVMQSNLLFSGTIAENIASGDDAPDRRRIEEVAKMADAHAFISKMPLGYEQIVGERGVGLSGGQIQRLCIARALYHDPRLLVFDEATSALDTQSESNILGNMHDILKGRTAVIIAHRLSTIMRADKILVLYEGAIVEQGRHDELVAAQRHVLPTRSETAECRMKILDDIEDLPEETPASPATSYAALLEKIEILRSTLRWSSRWSGPKSRSCSGRRASLRDEVMQLSHKERFVQAAVAEPRRVERSPRERREALLARSFIFRRYFRRQPASCWKHWKLPRRRRRPTFRCWWTVRAGRARS